MTEYFYGSCFKYRRFGGVGSIERTHLEDLIVRRTMMFSSPNSFNDPYDCSPIFLRGSDPAEDRANLGRAWDEGRVRAGHARLPRDARERHISEVMRQLSTPEGAASHFKPFLDRDTGVFCMSKDWRLLTQWAYYADGGRGLCLEYDVRPNEGFDCVFEVEYCDQRPRVEIVRLLHDSDYRRQALFASVIRKATDWAHEREVRALHTQPGILTHPERMLVAIMIGIAAGDEDVEWLLKILRENEIRVSVYRTALTTESFALQRRIVEQ